MWQFSIFIGNRRKHKTTDIWRCANEDQCVPDKTGCSCRTITRGVRLARQGCWCCACRSSSPVLHESYCRITSRRPRLARETGNLRSFSPARCRLQPVRQAPPRGEGDLYWQPAVAPVMAGQRPAVHRSERRRAHFCSERCIEGCLTDTLWDLQDCSTAITVWQICPNCFAVLTILIFVWRYDTCYLLYILSRQSKNDVSAAWCAHGNC